MYEPVQNLIKLGERQLKLIANMIFCPFHDEEFQPENKRIVLPFALMSLTNTKEIIIFTDTKSLDTERLALCTWRNVLVARVIHKKCFPVGFFT